MGKDYNYEINKKEFNKKRSYKDIDKDNGKKLKELIERFSMNKKECSEYFNCGETTITRRIEQYNINYENKKTHKTFLKQIKKLSYANEYKILEKYNGNDEKIKFKHNKCGKIFPRTPHNFLSGTKCPYCSHGHKKKTTEEFKKEVYELVGDEYQVLGEYINNGSGKNGKKILMKHNKCGENIKIRANDFLSGNRCPICYGNIRKTTEEFKKEVHELVGDEYTVLGKYENNGSGKNGKKILMKHNKCGHEWKARPNNFLTSNQRCPDCYGNIRKTTEEFKKEVYELVGDEYQVLGEYKNSGSKILIKHNSLECNYNKYKVSPNNFLSGYRCPQCNASKGEGIISDFLSNHNIKFESYYSSKEYKYKNKLIFDFYLYNKNIFIEYDGIQHFKPIEYFGGIEKFKIRRKRDSIKNRKSKIKNVKLIRIPYWSREKINIILKKLLIDNNINKLKVSSENQYFNEKNNYLLI
jgi:Zn ribbon nucleic-acid-binding protein